MTLTVQQSLKICKNKLQDVDSSTNSGSLHAELTIKRLSPAVHRMNMLIISPANIVELLDSTRYFVLKKPVGNIIKCD